MNNSKRFLKILHHFHKEHKPFESVVAFGPDLVLKKEAHSPDNHTTPEAERTKACGLCFVPAMRSRKQKFKDKIFHESSSDDDDEKSVWLQSNCMYS